MLFFKFWQAQDLHSWTRELAPPHLSKAPVSTPKVWASCEHCQVPYLVVSCVWKLRKCDRETKSCTIASYQAYIFIHLLWDMMKTASSNGVDRKDWRCDVKENIDRDRKKIRWKRNRREFRCMFFFPFIYLLSDTR